IVYLNDFAVWIVDADGANPRKLPKPEGEPAWPSWSRDGSLIAFQNDEDVYVVRPDGSGLRKVATNAGAPAFGPDLQLAFVIHAGGDAIRLVNLASGGVVPRAFRWNGFASPDALWWSGGAEILFRNGRGIAALNPQTRVFRSITRGPANDYNPSWTPDGRILFNSDR
ncbi:MAG: TolB family protein, partial [Actinomycetota bacterium]